MKNSVQLIGHLGRDPEMKTAGAQPLCGLRIATTRHWKGSDGQKREATDWHTVEVWGKLAELCGRYLTKGQLVSVSGRLQTEQWEDRETKAKRERTKVVADEVLFLQRAAKPANSGEGLREDFPPLEDFPLPSPAGEDP